MEIKPKRRIASKLVITLVTFTYIAIAVLLLGFAVTLKILLLVISVLLITCLCVLNRRLSWFKSARIEKYKQGAKYEVTDLVSIGSNMSWYDIQEVTKMMRTGSDIRVKGRVVYHEAMRKPRARKSVKILDASEDVEKFIREVFNI